MEICEAVAYGWDEIDEVEQAGLKVSDEGLNLVTLYVSVRSVAKLYVPVPVTYSQRHGCAPYHLESGTCTIRHPHSRIKQRIGAEEET
jgi:hypothetical protein